MDLKLCDESINLLSLHACLRL